MGIKLYRSPAEGTQLHRTGPSLTAIPLIPLVGISFATGGMSRGSHFSLQIEASSFAELAAAMVTAEPAEAARAFGAALAKASFPGEKAGTPEI